MTAQIQRALADTSTAGQKEAVRRATAMLVERPLGVIPLMQERVVVGVSPQVVGMTVPIAGYPDFSGVGMAVAQ